MENTIKINSNKKVEILMKPKRKHLELASYRLPKKKNETRDYVYGWGRVHNIKDVWTFIGWLNNNFNEKIAFTHLEYYSNEINDFKYWLGKVRDNNNVVATFTRGKDKFEMVLEERER